MHRFFPRTILEKNFRYILRTQIGFTLIELMISIAIIAIMIGIGAPAILKWMPNYRLKAAAGSLYSNMQRAKLEAVKQNVDVIISFTTGAYTPSGKVGSYLIFVDNSPANGVFDSGETIISNETMPANVSLYYASFTGKTTGFNSRGLPWNNRWGSIRMRNNNSRYYQISLSSAGAFRMTMNNNGIF